MFSFRFLFNLYYFYGELHACMYSMCIICVYVLYEYTVNEVFEMLCITRHGCIHAYICSYGDDACMSGIHTSIHTYMHACMHTNQVYRESLVIA